MVTLGPARTAQVTADIASLGSNLLMVRRDSRAVGRAIERDALQDLGRRPPSTSGTSRASRPSRRSRPESVTAIFGNANWTTQVTGSTNALFAVRNWSFRPAALSDAEVRGRFRVCVVGADGRAKLFGEADPVGRKIRLQQPVVQVIGLLTAKGQSTMGSDQDDVGRAADSARFSAASRATATSA